MIDKNNQELFWLFINRYLITDYIII